PAVGLRPPYTPRPGNLLILIDGDSHLDCRAAVNTLRFIHRAREFGFSIKRIRLLVSLWQDRHPSREVKKVALDHVAELERRIAELTDMHDALQTLANTCQGDHRPECPILRGLEDTSAPRVKRAA
ncbi:MerR family DNA-binding protein, partial [Acidisphaera sp. S103]|uniref:MerR family DNA-binding protein n=1 Tax=Acidisphaera sp. S103 TaxID=1747223 RepID=UPI00131DBB1C